MLASYDCHCDGIIHPGCEAWSSRGKFAFCLSPEDSGLYDEWMILETIEKNLKR